MTTSHRTSQQRRRLRVLAAGSVLALAAGALAAAPSIAAPSIAAPAPGPSAVTGTTGGQGLPTVVMPARVPAQAAAAAKPRHDVDGDGVSDMIVMEYDQVTAVYLSSIKAWSDYTIIKTDPDPEASFKDLLPVGDVGGTTQPELLSLTFDGVLTLYEAGVKSTSAPLWSGRGWQIYNRIIATGDLTGDRRPDLLARDPAGDLWLYTGTGTVSKPFNSRVKVGSGWGIYDQVVGANDVDGDGIGDVLTRTLAGELWFHKGAGSATAPLKPAVKVGTGWNTYNVITGSDDGDGDGRSDLLARNHDGVEYWFK
ncbi:hypothetical protein VR46_41680, partial [Streptomyces sp. NRRL S-444]